MEALRIARSRQREPGWYPRAEIARIFGVTTSYLDRDVRPHLPEGAERAEGRRVYLLAPAVFRVLTGRPGRGAAPSGPSPKDAAQIARAEQQTRLLELQVQEREGALIPRAAARPAWLQQRLASLGQALSRQHGPEALRTYNEFLRRLSAELEKGIEA